MKPNHLITFLIMLLLPAIINAQIVNDDYIVELDILAEKGLYFLELILNNEIEVQKVIKQ